LKTHESTNQHQKISERAEDQEETGLACSTVEGTFGSNSS